jgi:hypothetical protein
VKIRVLHPLRPEITEALNKRHQNRIQGSDSHNSIEGANLHGRIENLHSKFSKKKLAIIGNPIQEFNQGLHHMKRFKDRKLKYPSMQSC